MSERAPDYFEPIIAIRTWAVVWQDFNPPQLQSTTNNTLWPAKEPLKAKCTYHSHSAPRTVCTCGIYAKSENSSDDLAYYYSGIIGRVKLWGRVIPGEKGYRAEYAYPQSLEVSPMALTHIHPPEMNHSDPEDWLSVLTSQWEVEASEELARLIDALGKTYGIPVTRSTFPSMECPF